ncbi:MAG: hypothetical protein GXY16_06510 [Syntrophomonadaceae bacterium]|nr:hypothetical protein [Syntrophomonadaceae bacterium]NLT20634.1 hypothetical protein [Syntrophomonadaceae bacterium]
MKKKLYVLCLVVCFMFNMAGVAGASSEASSMSNNIAPNMGIQIQPTQAWLQAAEQEYQSDTNRVQEQINQTPAEFVSNNANGNSVTRATTTVYTGTNYTFSQADCGAHGAYDTYNEDNGNFKHGWGTTSGGYADALAQYTIMGHQSATTWAWVGKAIKVSGTRQARITYDGAWADYLIGFTTPVLTRGTVKISVYNATDGTEVASKTIVNNSNYTGIPVIDSDDFNDYLDVNLVNGKTYYLKMQCWAYVGAGAYGMADLISSNDVPARGGDGVDYNSINISWL